MAAAKHFPGHGDTSQDSHLTLPTVDKDTRDISEVELRPFRAAVRANVAAIMTAHVMFPCFDEEWPATLSTRILIEILRKDMSYNGLVVTDDLEMKAVADRFDLETQLQQACSATVVLFLACKSPLLQIQCYEGLIHLQEEEPVRQVTLAEQSEKRLHTARKRFMKNSARTPDFSVLNCNNHRDLVTMIKARGGE
jgi:beta-N-acetylhexosaminidase